MRDYKKAVLGMTLALSMVVTGSSLDGITAGIKPGFAIIFSCNI